MSRSLVNYLQWGAMAQWPYPSNHLANFSGFSADSGICVCFPGVVTTIGEFIGEAGANTTVYAKQAKF